MLEESFESHAGADRPGSAAGSDYEHDPTDPFHSKEGAETMKMDHGPVGDIPAEPAAKKKGGLVSKFSKMFATSGGDTEEGGEVGGDTKASGDAKGKEADRVGGKGGKKKRKKKKAAIYDDEFEPDVDDRPATPPTNPVYRERRMDATERPKEGFPWDLRESWHTYYIYVSTTHEDFLSELKAMFEEVIVELQAEYAAKRVKIVPIYLQDGLTAKESARCSAAVRFSEISRANLVIILQGRCYGDVPTDASVDHDAKTYDWLADYPRGRSHQELEVSYLMEEVGATFYPSP